ncbi:hypothetical protein H4219_004465, partial [Mycoemilia scoparia]
EKDSTIKLVEITEDGFKGDNAISDDQGMNNYINSLVISDDQSMDVCAGSLETSDVESMNEHIDSPISQNENYEPIKVELDVLESLSSDGSVYTGYIVIMQIGDDDVDSDDVDSDDSDDVDRDNYDDSDSNNIIISYDGSDNEESSHSSEQSDSD